MYPLGWGNHRSNMIKSSRLEGLLQVGCSPNSCALNCTSYLRVNSRPSSKEIPTRILNCTSYLRVNSRPGPFFNTKTCAIYHNHRIHPPRAPPRPQGCSSALKQCIHPGVSTSVIAQKKAQVGDTMCRLFW